MIKREFNIREDQDEFIRKLPGSDAENFRKALDMYIVWIKGLNVSASESKREEEDKDG